MITLERLRRVVSGLEIFTARLVNAGPAPARSRRIFGRDVVVGRDVMMVEIERDLGIIGHAVFKFLAKIDHAVAAMFLLPARRKPLLELAMSHRGKISRISPGND